MELCQNQKNINDTLSWELTSDNKKLKLNNKGTLVSKDIVKITKDSLMLRTITPNGDSQVFLYLKY